MRCKNILLVIRAQVPSMISHASFSQHRIDSTTWTCLPFFAAKRRQYNSFVGFSSKYGLLCSTFLKFVMHSGLLQFDRMTFLTKVVIWMSEKSATKIAGNDRGCQWGLFRAASATCCLCPRRHPHFYIFFLSFKSDYSFSQLITLLKLVGLEIVSMEKGESFVLPFGELVRLFKLPARVSFILYLFFY